MRKIAKGKQKNKKKRNENNWNKVLMSIKYQGFYYVKN